jgi:hypothetical protein
MKFFDTGGQLRRDVEIEPQEFLELAEEDLDRGGASALLNAITNAKRAIHCQVDYVLDCLGYDSHQLPTAKKFALFERFGFVAPRILKRVTEQRNVLEHEYRRPTFEQVADAVDVAALFVEAVARHLRVFDDRFVIARASMAHADAYGHFLAFHYSFDAYQFNIYAGEDGVASYGEAIVKSGDIAFPACVGLAAAGDRATKVQRAVRAFLDAVNQM